MSNQRLIGRPVISKYEGTDLETVVCNKVSRVQGQYKYIFPGRVTLTSHQQEDNRPEELPSVV